MSFPHTWTDGSGQAISAAALTEIEAAITATTTAANLLKSVVRPSDITTTTHNWAPSAAATTFFKTDGSGNKVVTGIVAGYDGEQRLYVNVGVDDVTFNDEDSNSTAANQLICPGGVNFTVAADEMFAAVYEAGSKNRWRLS